MHGNYVEGGRERERLGGWVAHNIISSYQTDLLQSDMMQHELITHCVLNRSKTLNFGPNTVNGLNICLNYTFMYFIHLKSVFSVSYRISQL